MVLFLIFTFSVSNYKIPDNQFKFCWTNLKKLFFLKKRRKEKDYQTVLHNVCGLHNAQNQGNCIDFHYREYIQQNFHYFLYLQNIKIRGREESNSKKKRKREELSGQTSQEVCPAKGWNLPLRQGISDRAA